MRLTVVRKPAAAALGLWLLLLASGIDPHFVLCHKPDGRVDVEAENAVGECRCGDCLRESGGGDRGVCLHEPGTRELKPLSCRHEKIPAAAALAPLREPRHPSVSPGLAEGWAGRGADDAAPPSALLPSFAQRLHKPPPLVCPILRC